MSSESAYSMCRTLRGRVVSALDGVQNQRTHGDNASCGERGEYYQILEQIQRGTMDVTAWMEWLLGCLTRAIEGAQAALSSVIEKARYWEKLPRETNPYPWS